MSFSLLDEARRAEALITLTQVAMAPKSEKKPVAAKAEAPKDKAPKKKGGKKRSVESWKIYIYKV